MAGGTNIPKSGFFQQ